ncbi:MAG TPA: glutamine synthetase family protein [Usitatibacter sp.]|jgi:glutamine synthetase|nr:glutamine synthetase family protein [Usitatibacter sp.]
MKKPAARASDGIVDAIRKSTIGKVKVAVADIDGILRGKYLHRDKFFSAVESGFGFCDVVLGWDMHDQCYDNTRLTGWHHGYPDAMARLDLGTYRNVPWDGGVPFFLGDFVTAQGTPHPACPRQVLKRVLARAQKLGYTAMIGSEFEFFNFSETPQTWAEKRGQPPTPISPGMFGYSLLRANMNREYFNALMDEMAQFRVPIEGLHTETGPGVYEAAILFCEALEAADRAILFKTGAKEIGSRFGIMPSFMAKWSAQYPGCSGHLHQSLSDGSRNLFHDPKGRHGGMSKLFESYLQGQLDSLMGMAPMFWPTVNSYKRLVDGFWAPVKPTWGVDNRTATFRVLPGSPKATRLETRAPGADMNPYLATAAVLAAGLDGIEKGRKLTAPPITGTNVGAEKIPRAPRTLIETTRIFRESKVARDWFGDDFVDHFAATREWEWRQWLDAVTDWELRRYFEII